MDRQAAIQPKLGGRPITAKDLAVANEYFEHFLNASSLKNIQGCHHSICEHLNLRPNPFPLFYPKLRACLTSWRAKALWKKFDARAAHKCYGKGKVCASSRVLIIGGGPCGMRTAIEAQLLGAKVVVIEKRDRFSRNNVLHLWPFLIEDLRTLGAKKFFGKFCAGAIDHISIRQLQCILLKVALLLGVEVHTEVSFERLIEPNDKTGWRAEFHPSDHPVAQYEFDVIIGADGKRNTLEGFKRKEFRGKLAIAITANFINKRTEAEARVEEISGVAFIFNQKFFRELHEETGIDLENIVYYKDDTHYFVMTAKKHSLIEKGVIKQDLADTERLLAMENVDRAALESYARQAANFSTNDQMPDVEFAVNHYGQSDVAMFDFTSMYAAENASKVVERSGQRLLMILVGDSLLEPFWPTGSGCARGFLSSLDAAWAIRSWCMGTMNALEVVAERESIYRLLAQTTPDNLNKDWKAYTLEPGTRYPNLNRGVVVPHQCVGLFDSDNPKSVERLRRNSRDLGEVPKKRRRGNVDNKVLLEWIKEQVRKFPDIAVTDLASVFQDGNVLCAILNHYRPDLLDYNVIKDETTKKKNQLAIDILDKEIGILPIMTGEELTKTDDYLSMAAYLTQIYDSFRCEIPHIKHPKLELPDKKKIDVNFHAIRHQQSQTTLPFNRPSSRHKRHCDNQVLNNKTLGTEKKARKRRTFERGVNVAERQRALEEIASNRNDRYNKRKHQRKLQTEQFIKSMQMLQANAKADGQPFEDYSIFLYRQTAPNFEDRVKDLEKKFTYIPEHDQSKQNHQTRPSCVTDECLAAKVKTFEDRWREPQPVEKKPRDLLRAIGKIETSDWNIKEIEKKIRENKLGKTSADRDKEKVPKWSSEQFKARQNKMEKKHLEREDSGEAKFADFDRNVRQLELRLKEGSSRDLGQSKVATLTEKLVKAPQPAVELKAVQKSPPRPITFPQQGPSDICHFCAKRVYLMERLSAEGRFFHHGCFRCQHCRAPLRLGSYAFDRDGRFAHRFYCAQHFGLPEGAAPAARPARRASQRRAARSPGKRAGIGGVDLLDRVLTPERVEFANLTACADDADDGMSQMDEDEWTDRNFGASAAEYGSSDESSYSESESDDEEAYEEALDEPPTKEGTLKWAERYKKRYSKKRHDSDSNSYSSSDSSYYEENSSDDDDSDTPTEDEDEIRARELRKQEVNVEPPFVHTDTGTDTEIVFSSSSSSSEIRNSATEISTDSEFAHDDPTPTRDAPPPAFSDRNVTLRRGQARPGPVRKIQVTSGYLQRPLDKSRPRPPKPVELKLTPLVPASPLLAILKHAAPRPNGQSYALNRTQSTGGIAAKVSLELKKRYLLGGGEKGGGAIQKSGSASTLDTKLKSFNTNISDCQKLLRSATGAPVPPTTIVTRPIEAKADAEPEGEMRPRSPLHETSIVVPHIDWGRAPGCTSSSEESVHYLPIPTVKIDEVLLDSIEPQPSEASSCKSAKSLNQPKTLPALEQNHDLHAAKEEEKEESDGIGLTETELSDWARDGAVSDDFEDGAFELNLDSIGWSNRCKKGPKLLKTDEHVCGKENEPVIDALNSVLCRNSDIEFMDTESSSEENGEQGYVLFKNEEMAEDSLNPILSPVEAGNNSVKNTGYCVIGDEANNFGSEVINLKPADLVKVQKGELDEDSLLILETFDTTEEITCSDSTVKNVTEVTTENNQKKRMEEKLAKLKAEVQKPELKQEFEFDEHCQRLQSKVEFSNARDSIDIRKSKRKSSKSSESGSPQKPDLIQEEASPVAASPKLAPDVVNKREIIAKERDVNQKLIQEMVMNKMRSENKSLERKNRKSRNFDVIQPNLVEMNRNNNNSIYATPDVLLSTLNGDFKTPVAPPRAKHEEAKRTAEKLKQEARTRARLLSNEELGLSPDEKFIKLRQKLQKPSLIEIDCLLTDKKANAENNAKPVRTKSIGEMATLGGRGLTNYCKSDPNLLETTDDGKKKKRKQSFSKMLTTFFRKSPSSSPKGLLSRIAKGKSVSKSCANLDQRYSDVVDEEDLFRRKSLSEINFNNQIDNCTTPPPIPPLPRNYTGRSIKDESSDGDDYRRTDDSNDALDDHSAIFDASASSLTHRRSSKGARRTRQAQLKRHRMAQEIQRKLEETEVKTRDLEERGVVVEKALRGEESRYARDESELLGEWFELMRDKTELRRYERELIVRAQELELEDRHARLQHDLRERLENHEKKTQDDVEIEGGIISEMMRIVKERDALINLLEEDRLRYSNEDKDFEEQMLAKGLRLTPIRKAPEA